MRTDTPRIDKLIARADEDFNRGDLKAARATLTEAIQQAPNSFAAHLALGFVCYQTNDLAAARDAFICAAELSPTNVAAHTNLAIVLQRLGQLPEAETTLQTALELDADNPELLQMLAILQMEQRNYVPAAQLLYELLQKKPADTNLLVALGKCFYQEGDLQTARDCFGWAVQNAPEHELACHNLAALERSQARIAA